MSSQDEGGIGFMSLVDFNTAMLGKQSWRLIEKLNYLFDIVLKNNILRIQVRWNLFAHTRHHTAGRVLFQLDLWLAND